MYFFKLKIFQTSNQWHELWRNNWSFYAFSMSFLFELSNFLLYFVNFEGGLTSHWTDKRRRTLECPGRWKWKSWWKIGCFSDYPGGKCRQTLPEALFNEEKSKDCKIKVHEEEYEHWQLRHYEEKFSLTDRECAQRAWPCREIRPVPGKDTWEKYGWRRKCPPRWVWHVPRPVER